MIRGKIFVMVHTGLRALTIVLIFVISGSCRPSARNPDVVVLMGKHRIYKTALETYLKETLGRDHYAASSEILSSLLDNYIDEELLLLEAVRQGYPPEGNRSMTIIRFMENLCSQLTEPSKDQIQQYFKLHRKEFKFEKACIFREIMLNDKTLADRLLKEVKSGADFGQLARDHSLAPNAAEGGLVGPIEFDHIPENIRDILKDLKSGSVSETIEVPYGYLMFQMIKSIPGGDLSLDDVYDDIVTHLKEEACVQLKQKLINDIEKKEHVWILTHHLLFPYSGKYPSWQSQA